MFNFFKKLMDHIDLRLADELKGCDLSKFTVNSKNVPSLRFVDFFRSIERYCEKHQDVSKIVSEHLHYDLNDLLKTSGLSTDVTQITKSLQAGWATGYEEETFLPVDCFWVLKGKTEETQIILRLRHVTYSNQTYIEAGCGDETVAQDVLEEILKDSEVNSIYRNRILQLSFESGSRDEFGDIEKAEQLRVIFKREEEIADEDFVAENKVRDILKRNVLDLHLRRDVLRKHDVPVRRGVLMYGPPGTGKTYACRYLCNKLPETTRILVSGTALNQVGAIFSLARILKPALIILEDVDLVFTSRDINLYSSALGDLLDHMDGLRPNEDISIILTTNAIDRIEAAIKDRPGRVSQCIYMGTPNVSLRQQYLERYLRNYEIKGLNLDRLVDLSEGSTQAFMKEWVHRSVQIATERLKSTKSKLVLKDKDFSDAIAEMKDFEDESAGRILGFYTPKTQS